MYIYYVYFYFIFFIIWNIIVNLFFIDKGEWVLKFVEWDLWRFIIVMFNYLKEKENEKNFIRIKKINFIFKVIKFVCIYFCF